MFDEEIKKIKKRLDSIESKLDFVINHLKYSDISTISSGNIRVEKKEQGKHTPYEMYQRKKRWVKDSYLKSTKKSEINLTKIEEKDLSLFRGAKIPKSEVKILEKIENSLNMTFKYLCDETYNPQMTFRVINNRVIELGLNDCGLKDLPEDIGGLEALQIIIVSENNLSTLPDSIGNLKNLEEIFCECNHLKSLPDQIGNAKSLKYLNLDQNELKSLPESITMLVNLEILRVNKNLLENLPESIGNLKNLLELYLNDNLISTFPNSIENLTNLEVLALRHNKLISFPNSIEKLLSLESLDLLDNKLTKLPVTLKNLPRIQYICIKQNPLDLSENSSSKKIIDDLVKKGVRI